MHLVLKMARKDPAVRTRRILEAAHVSLKPSKISMGLMALEGIKE
jgi:hypothetical protein